MNVARAIMVDRIAEIDAILKHKVQSQAATDKLKQERASKLNEIRRMDAARKPAAVAA